MNQLEQLETTSMEYGSSQYLVWKCSLREKMAAHGQCTKKWLTCEINKTVVFTIIIYTPTAIQNHKNKNGPPYRTQVVHPRRQIQRGNQLLIILSLVCKFCINLVHVAMPNRYWKRQFVNRNTVGRTINAETVCHTIYFWHEMIIVNARYSETSACKGQAN